MITLSEDGIAIYDESMRRFPTVAKEVYDVTGCGGYGDRVALLRPLMRPLDR
jgi:bifunctional ADP-heptose synthase (sugar kinase/adenylyltransferase)